MLKIGDIAPDFSLKDQDGHEISLAQILKKSLAVVFFYPKNNTPACTAESCSFRDNYQGFRDLGAQVIGISDDSLSSHKDFASKHNLPYPLLSDNSGHVRMLYGLKKTFGLVPPRASFVIDQQGLIRNALSSQLNFQRHIDDSLQCLRAIRTCVL